jgi:hypothetical protein
MRLRISLAAATVLAALLAGQIGDQARAALPTIIHWHGETWQMYLVYSMNPAHPNPKVGRLLGRTTALDRFSAEPPVGLAQRWPVSVYTLPKIDRHVAVYVTGGHVHRELLVRRGWRVNTGSPLARVMNYSGAIPG